MKSGKIIKSYIKNGKIEYNIKRGDIITVNLS